MPTKITYSMIREKMKGEPYEMVLRGDDAKVVELAVNAGIDAHLEACFYPERGDKYEWQCDPLAEYAAIAGLHCQVSLESLPVLLRRLSEMDPVDDCEDCFPDELASTILETLGFKVETGCYEIIAPADEEADETDPVS
jgi:hypothetical protein